MTFTEAAEARLPFGKYCGLTVEKVAVTDEGLRYLDWLRGKELYGRIKEAVDIYLDEPAIAEDLERVIER